MNTLGIILIVAGVICFFIGNVVGSIEGNQENNKRKTVRPQKYGSASSDSWPSSSSPIPARRSSYSPPTLRKDLKKQTTPLGKGGWMAPMKGKPGDFASAQIGQMITYQHPQRGVLRMEVLGTIRYSELWQKQKSPVEPWVPTGNVFTAHWLGDDTLLYEWKGMLMALDNFESVSDADIKRTFLEPARKFGQSDETANVSFAYPPGSWIISDIGKFRVEEASGNGLRLSDGAVGRFVHAEGGTGLENQMLIVEDYQEDGGGGLDTVWRGWRISWDDILEINDRGGSDG